MSFFSKAFYRDVVYAWKGTGFCYLFFLTILVSIPATYFLNESIGHLVEDVLPGYIEQIEEFSIIKGKVSTTSGKPFSIVDPETGAVQIIVNPTGERIDPGTYPLTIIERERIIYRKSDIETRTYQLANIDDFVINKEYIKNLIKEYKGWTIAIIYPLILVFSYIYYIIQVLLFGIIAMLIAKLNKVIMSYGTCLRLSIIAFTPALILRAINDYMVNVSLTGVLGWLYVILTIFYIFYGIRAAKGWQNKSGT